MFYFHANIKHIFTEYQISAIYLTIFLYITNVQRFLWSGFRLSSLQRIYVIKRFVRSAIQIDFYYMNKEKHVEEIVDISFGTTRFPVKK
jgi:hypothetical protein